MRSAHRGLSQPSPPVDGGLSVFRKVLFWLHLGGGLTAGSVVLVMALTGMTLAFEPQILEAVERGIRQIKVPEGDVPQLSLDELAAKASGTLGGAEPSGVTVYSGSHRSVVISFGKKGGAVYVNPYTGEILGGESRTHKLLHQLEDIHRRLAWKEKGEAVTGAANALMLFLVISGLYLWWPKSWHWNSLKAVTVFNPRLRGKPRDWNRHNVFGFWCLPMLLVTTLTGLIMSYSWANALFFRLAGSEPPAQKQEAPAGESERSREILRPPSGNIRLESLFSKAAEKSSSWEAISFRLPQKAGAPVTVLIMEKAPAWYPKARSQLTLDPATGAEVKWEPYTAHSPGRIGRTWVRYLHTGEALGLPGQVLALIGSGGAVMLIWTGFAMSGVRFWRRGSPGTSGGAGKRSGSKKGQKILDPAPDPIKIIS